MGGLKNQILISMPHIKDPFFSKAIVYICEHEENGAIGLIVNKAMDTSKSDGAFKKSFFANSNYSFLKNKIFFGGPVLMEKGIVLHHTRYKSDKSILVSDSISITNESDILIKLKKKGNIPFKLMLGHAGWSKGQLEKEIEAGDWLIQNTTCDFIFNTPPHQMWKHAAESIGLDLGSSFGVTGKA